MAAKYWLPLANIYIRWFYNRADLILAVSDETKHQLIQLGVKKPIDVFYNIIDTKRYASSPKIKAEARKKLGIDTDTFMVVCSGQVQPRKRVDTFLNVAKKLDMHFVWVGGMPFGAIAADNHRLNEVMKNSPKNVQFTGVIPLDDVKQYYQAADVFFLPSEQETFGLVVVEAAAAGLPVLLRDIPDYAQTFAGDAIMSDEAGFAKQLQRLADDSKYYTKAVAGSNRIAKRYDSTAGAATAVALYKNLLKK